MTEAEARELICCGPPAVALATRAAHDKYTAATHNSYNCCASACAAWRWSEAKRSAAFLEAVQAHMQGMAKPNFNIAVQAVYAERGGQFERVEGYCGLAGAA